MYWIHISQNEKGTWLRFSRVFLIHWVPSEVPGILKYIVLNKLYFHLRRMLCIHRCLSVCLSVCPSVFLTVCSGYLFRLFYLSVCQRLSLSLYVCLFSVHVCLCLSLYLSVCSVCLVCLSMSVDVCLCLSVLYVSVSVSVCRSVYLSVCLSVCLDGWMDGWMDNGLPFLSFVG